jgi:hypothetical protein
MAYRSSVILADRMPRLPPFTLDLHEMVSRNRLAEPASNMAFLPDSSCAVSS